MKKERWRAKDYVVIPRSILTANISPSALRLWIALASFCYDEDKCFPSNKSILDRMPEGTALNTCQAAKRELEEKGLIKRERRFDKGRETSSLYILIAPKGTTMVEGNETDTPNPQKGNDKMGARGNAQVVPLNKSNINKQEEAVKITKEGDVFIKGVGWVDKPNGE
jgi:hypothetical protein